MREALDRLGLLAEPGACPGCRARGGAEPQPAGCRPRGPGRGRDPQAQAHGAGRPPALAPATDRSDRLRCGSREERPRRRRGPGCGARTSSRPWTGSRSMRRAPRPGHAGSRRRAPPRTAAISPAASQAASSLPAAIPIARPSSVTTRIAQPIQRSRSPSTSNVARAARLEPGSRASASPTLPRRSGDETGNQPEHAVKLPGPGQESTPAAISRSRPCARSGRARARRPPAGP